MTCQTSSVERHLLQRIGILREIVGRGGGISVVADCSNSSVNQITDNHQHHHRRATTCRNSCAQQSCGCCCSGNIEPRPRPEVMTVITINSKHPTQNPMQPLIPEPCPHRQCSEVQGRWTKGAVMQFAALYLLREKTWTKGAWRGLPVSICQPRWHRTQGCTMQLYGRAHSRPRQSEWHVTRDVWFDAWSVKCDVSLPLPRCRPPIVWYSWMACLMCAHARTHHEKNQACTYGRN